jgi:large subunit ribosomal protein L9
MKVVLRADVDNVGKKGDVLDVADGFGRNFLVPKGLAMVASKGVAAQAAAMRRSRDLKDARDRESAEVVARDLVATVIRIPAKAGAEGRLFGSVTSADVVEAVQAQAGVELDRRRLHLTEPIKSLGTHQVPVKLHADVEFLVTVEVVGQGR